MVQLRNYKMHLTSLHHGQKRNAVTYNKKNLMLRRLLLEENARARCWRMNGHSVVLTFSPQINNINFRLALTDVAAVPQSSGYGTAHPKTSSS